MYSDNTKQVRIVASYEGVQCRLKAGESDMLTIVPTIDVGGSLFAPIGLTNMLNTRGSISQWTRVTSAPSEASFKVRLYILAGVSKLHVHPLRLQAQNACPQSTVY